MFSISLHCILHSWFLQWKYKITEYFFKVIYKNENYSVIYLKDNTQRVKLTLLNKTF